jgi:hypothetical protein
MSIAAVTIVSADGTASGYQLGIHVSAYDGINHTSPTLVVVIPPTTREHFNDAILNTAIDWLTLQNVTINPRDIYYQTFERGE